MGKVKNNLNIQKKVEYQDFSKFNGLNSQEILQKIKEKKVNIVTKKEEKTILSIIFNHLFNLLNLLVLLVALFIFYLGYYYQLFFLVANFFNLCIGIFQEIRAKRILDKISLLMLNNAQVIRNGSIIEIDSCEIVMDDLLYLELGRQILVDAKVQEGFIEVDESLLTGESNAVAKKKGDFLFSGSYVLSGKACAKVQKVGNDIYINKISQDAKKYHKTQTPLMKSLSLFVKMIIFVIFFMTLLMSYRYSLFDQKPNFNDYFVHLCGFIIGMLPTGIFLLVNLTLTFGAVRLAKNKIYVQDLFAIEMLSQVNVLCLDKTGTITDGNMEVKKVIKYQNNNINDLSIGRIIMQMISIQNNFNFTNDALRKKFDDPKLSFFPYKILDSIYFSSARKYSAVEFDQLGSFFLGSPEFILQKDFILIKKEVEEQFKLGYRVLLLAKNNFSLKEDSFFKKKEILALIIIEDSIKEDVFSTIDYFKKNGVLIKIISGDNHLALSNIAEKVGITDSIKSVSLENVSDEEVRQLSTRYNIFGRATPQQKKILIDTLKQKNFKVAMIGDGINDILAFKVANVSIAMGSGNSSTRNLANIVLLDSQFHYMPNLVSEGRRVVNNLEKTTMLFFTKTILSFLLGLTFLILSLVGNYQLFFPIEPLQLNLIDVFSIGIPSFFLSLEANNKIIKGDNFVFKVLKKAFPFSFLVLLNYLFLFYSVHSENQNLISIFLNCSLFIVFFSLLLKICFPFNKWKIILFISMLIFYFICFPLIMSKGFEFSEVIEYLHQNPIFFKRMIIFLIFNFFYVFTFSFFKKILKNRVILKSKIIN